MKENLVFRLDQLKAARLSKRTRVMPAGLTPRQKGDAQTPMMALSSKIAWLAMTCKGSNSAISRAVKELTQPERPDITEALSKLSYKAQKHLEYLIARAEMLSAEADTLIDELKEFNKFKQKIGKEGQ